jgi:NADH-quinone oxidoreductase subunit L
MSVVAALLTSFYMARLMAKTFLGENRTGEQERAHLHDAPLIMTGPLVVLGVFSALGGLLNLPRFMGGGGAMEHWLEPVMAPAARTFGLEMPHGNTEFVLIAAAVAIGAVGLVLGWWLTMRQHQLSAAESPADRGFARVLHRKYYVDELYDALIVRPLVWLSRVVLWRGVDQGVVDGAAVNGTARLSRGLGWLGSRLQTGQVGVYIILFLAGVLWVLHTVVQ